jgi:hypothetical protein
VGVGEALVPTATGVLGAGGVADVTDAEEVADAVTAPDEEGALDAVCVADVERDAGDVEVPGSEGTEDADAAGADGVGVAMAVGAPGGVGSEVGLAIACGTRADTQRVTNAATLHHRPRLRPPCLLAAT